MARKRNKRSYEGQQYRGGRTKGNKNLVKLPGGAVQNKHGVSFTEAERKALENAVNAANRKRKKMIDELGGLKTSSGGTVGQLLLMGRENDFVITRKSKSLNQFKSRDSFKAYMKNLKKVNSPNYLHKRAKEYKRNFIEGLRRVYGYDDTNDIVHKIQFMNWEKFMKIVTTDETLEIGYASSSLEPIYEKLNEVRASLGMKLKDY